MDRPKCVSSSLADLADRFQAASTDGAVSIREVTASIQIALRGDPDNAEFRSAVETALFCALPKEACSAQYSSDGHKVLWLGPHEWLFVGETDVGSVSADAVVVALAPFHAAAVDVSAARLVIELSGPDARNVLEKMCLHDLHPRAFATGRVVGTLMFKTPVLLEQIDARPTYHLYVRPSFARHLADLIMDAMAEFPQGSASGAS